MLKAEDLLSRIQELQKLQFKTEDYQVFGQLYSGTIAIAVQIWGENGAYVKTANQLREDMQKSSWSGHAKGEFLVQQCHGILESMASDIRGGRIGSLRLEFQGQVFAGLLNAAKHALAEGKKDVGAVLAAAALEDTLKRYAEAKGLNAEDADLSNVVNALKGVGLLSATQGSLLKGMIPFRNKALHAEWTKIETAEVQGVIAFLGEFLATRFT